MTKRIARGVGLVLLALAAAAAVFVYAEAFAFDASVAKVYTIEPPRVAASSDPELIARGKHLTEIFGCAGCHGADLGGKGPEKMGPLGTIYVPNLTAGRGGVLGRYSDPAFGRLIRDGVKADGHSLRFMPAQDLSWLPDRDLSALVSYLRTVPKVDRVLPESKIGTIGKVIDRLGMVPLDIARHIDHTAARPTALEPSPTREYGANLARACQSCHGKGLSGGKIPGAPRGLPIPANLTPDETGIKAYSEADFMRLIDTGVKRNGKPLDPFMPIATLRAMNPIERRALYAYLMSLPPRHFGKR